MTELLPCPFCGGNARLTTWSPTAASISCIMCGAHFNTYTEAEAVEAWNTRAERTCECVAEYGKSPIDGKTIVLHRCSECHEFMRPHMNYCPNCRAKVVD